MTNDYGHIYLDKIIQDNAGRWYATLRQDPSGDGSWGQISTPRRNDRAQMLKDVDFGLQYKGEIMDILATNLFEYLSGEMFLDKNGQPVVGRLTMKSVEAKNISNGRGGEEGKFLLSFEERDKKLVLNKSNAKAIIKQYGRETDDWRGKKIALTGEPGSWFGKKGVRVVVLDYIPANGKPAKKAKKKAAPPPVVVDDADLEQGDLFEDELTGGAFAE